MRQLLEVIWRVVLDGLFPAFCLGCKIEGTFLCRECFKLLPALEAAVCAWCYRLGDFGATCTTCKVLHPGLDGLVAASKFEEHALLQRAIHALKYDFVEELQLPLGKFLFEAFLPLVQRFPEKNFVLCPLPLHDKRQRWRGFNQAELLCFVVIRELQEAGYWNVEMCQLLRRVHFSRPQMELHREERLVNMRDAFEVRADVTGSATDSIVVLVDDIATTLSTLNSAALTLKKAGVQEVYGLVLARVF